jgi:CRP-like cAMP-binding protein
MIFADFLEDLAGMSHEEAFQFAGAFQKENITKGDYLLREGELCKHTFFVESGLLRMYSIDSRGKEHILQFACEGWFISDRSSIYFNEPSDYFIDAIEDTTYVILDPAALQSGSGDYPEFRAFNERALHNHIRQLQKRITSLIGASAEERYSAFTQLYADLIQRVPQWMIASYLGITPESLSRVRKSIVQKG